MVNASSEEGMTAVNGMSYSDRSGPNANSAMIVTVGPADFASCHQEGTSPVLDGSPFSVGWSGRHSVRETEKSRFSCSGISAKTEFPRSWGMWSRPSAARGPSGMCGASFRRR